MIKTHVTWNKNFTNEEIISINEFVDRMVQEDKTDGVLTWILNTESEKIAERHWFTVESAEEWIVFIETFSPVSAEIIN